MEIVFLSQIYWFSCNFIDFLVILPSFRSKLFRVFTTFFWVRNCNDCDVSIQIFLTCKKAWYNQTELSNVGGRLPSHGLISGSIFTILLTDSNSGNFLELTRKLFAGCYWYIFRSLKTSLDENVLFRLSQLAAQAMSIANFSWFLWCSMA